MGEHIVDGKFKSDKYDWCEPDFLAFKFSDKLAQPRLTRHWRARMGIPRSPRTSRRGWLISDSAAKRAHSATGVRPGRALPQ
jgi:hypothetical protein